MKKLLIVSIGLLSLGSISLVAKQNKQQIRLSNQSSDKNPANRDILVHMTWKNGIETRYSDVILKSHSNDSMFKAPISGYKLFSIDVTPSINLSSLAAGAAPLAVTGTIGLDVAAIAYGITHSLNHHTIRAHGNKFFVIDTENKASMIQSQKQVRIRGYKTQEEYQKAINGDISKEKNLDAAQDETIIDATQDENKNIKNI